MAQRCGRCYSVNLNKRYIMSGKDKLAMYYFCRHCGYADIVERKSERAAQ